jgi:hypothetical protein
MRIGASGDLEVGCEEEFTVLGSNGRIYELSSLCDVKIVPTRRENGMYTESRWI